MYPPDDRAMGDALSAWLMDATGSGDKEIAVVNQFPGIEGYKLREDALRDALKSNPDAKIVAEEEVDYTNLVEDVQRDISQVLGKSPDVDALYSLTNDIPPIVTALRTKGKTAEDGPMVLGFFGDKANLDAIRAGTADAIAEWPLEADVWSAVDVAAQSIANDTPAPETLDGAYSLDFAQPIVVSSENLPPEGEYAAPAADFVSYFKAKWGEEFGAGAKGSGGGGS
jgi:ABC-type sugar transport system substrate-binding protein